MRFRKIIFVLIFLLLTNTNNSVFADDRIEENIEFSDIQSMLLENATVEADKEPSINSRHAVVYDRTSGEVLYGKKENEKCKMASTTKIMTAIVVIENESNLSKSVKVSSKAAGTGGSRLGLHKEDEVTINDLLYGLLLCSRQ